MAPPSGDQHAPVFSEVTIEAVCRPLAEATRARQIAGLIAPLRIQESAAGQTDTKWVRLARAVTTAQRRQGDGRPLLRLVSEVMAPVRFASPDEFEAHRVAVNERLLLSGYAVRVDGRLERVKRSTTLSEAQQRADYMRSELQRRGVHPEVLKFCRPELMQQNHFHAVLEASKSVADRLRQLTGVNQDGWRLVDATCMSSSGQPLVAFNSLSTEWEWSEQKGLATLIKGLFGTFRNPAAHAPRVVWATSSDDALDALTLASMIHRRLDGARVTTTE